jgi:hypothetical protein
MSINFGAFRAVEITLKAGSRTFTRGPSLADANFAPRLPLGSAHSSEELSRITAILSRQIPGSEWNALNRSSTSPVCRQGGISSPPIRPS